MLYFILFEKNENQTLKSNKERPLFGELTGIKIDYDNDITVNNKSPPKRITSPELWEDSRYI